MAELPGRSVRAGHGQAAGQQHPADAGRDVQVQGDRHAAQHAPARLRQPGQGRIVAGQDRARGHHGPQRGGHVDALPFGQGRLDHRAAADGRRDRDAHADDALTELPAADRQSVRGIVQHSRARTGPPLLAVQYRAAAGQLERGHGKGVIPQVDRERDRALGVRRRHAGRAPAGTLRRHVDRAGQLLDQPPSGQVADEHGGRAPGQAELPGELGPGELAAAVVDGAQQPHEIMRAQFGTGGRGTLVPTHTYDRAIPVSRGGYQSQWKPTAVCSARRR